MPRKKIRFVENAHAPYAKFECFVPLIKSALSYHPAKVTFRPRRVKTVILIDDVDNISVVWIVDVVSSVTGAVTVTKAVATAPVRELGEVAHPTREYSE